MMFGYNGRLQRWYISPLSLTCIPALTMHPCFSAEPTSYLLPLLCFSFYLFLVLLFHFILFIMFNLFIVYCQLFQMTFNKDILARKMERITRRGVETYRRHSVWKGMIRGGRLRGVREHRAYSAGSEELHREREVTL